MEGAVIRRATIDYYASLCAVYDDTDAYHAAGQGDVFRLPDTPGRPREQLQRALAGDDEALLVADVGGEVVGLAWVIVRGADAPSMVSRRFAVVDALAVREGFRRHGLGRLLMEAAEAWARNRGLAEVELSVAGFNRDAIAFYERLGYSTLMRRMRRTFTGPRP